MEKSVVLIKFLLCPPKPRDPTRYGKSLHKLSKGIFWSHFIYTRFCLDLLFVYMTSETLDLRLKLHLWGVLGGARSRGNKFLIKLLA